MDSDKLLAEIREHVELIGGQGNQFSRATSAWEWWQDAAEALAGLVGRLDSHLSAGGTPPEEWREGPDAVGEEACPRTGRSASACSTPDHRDCPDLRLRHVLGRVASGNITPTELQRELSFVAEPLGGPIPGVNGSHLPEGAWKPSERPGVL